MEDFEKDFPDFDWKNTPAYNKIGAVVIQKIPYMQSDQCFYCKFGSGGFDRKNELPPI